MFSPLVCVIGVSSEMRTILGPVTVPLSRIRPFNPRPIIDPSDISSRSTVQSSLSPNSSTFCRDFVYCGRYRTGFRLRFPLMVLRLMPKSDLMATWHRSRIASHAVYMSSVS